MWYSVCAGAGPKSAAAQAAKALKHHIEYVAAPATAEELQSFWSMWDDAGFNVAQMLQVRCTQSSCCAGWSGCIHREQMLATFPL
jgi:hypothetical protein